MKRPNMLALLALAAGAWGADVPLPGGGSTHGNRRRERSPAPDPGPDPDPRAECLRFHGKIMWHHMTNEIRSVRVLDYDVVFLTGRGRDIRRSFSKALKWLRNADEVQP